MVIFGFINVNSYFMENNNTTPIIISGKHKKYVPKFFETIPSEYKYNYENCIVCFYILRLDERNQMLRRYVNVEYFELVTNEIFEDCNFGVYAPNGFFILYADSNEVGSIIDDIRKSDYFLH